MPTTTSVLATRRRQKRDDLFGEKASLVWGSKGGRKIGFAQVPRTVSLVATLIDELEKAKNASRVYLDLWLRAYDDGMLIVNDENAFAHSAGCINVRRGIRSWRERIDVLAKYGFILVRPGSNQARRFILLPDPDIIISDEQARLRTASGARFFDAWLNMYKEMKADHGLLKSETPV